MAETQIKHIKHTIMTQKMTQFNSKSSVGHSDDIYFPKARHCWLNFPETVPSWHHIKKYGVNPYTRFWHA